MAGLQQTTFNQGVTSTRADFNRPDFETLIQQKGRKVILETSLQCACKGKSTNQQSNCRNCGGTGWVYINPRETKLILQGMNITPNYKAWSEEITGDLKVTSSDTEEITFMDRFTILDGRAIFNEVLFFKNRSINNQQVTFAYTSYAPKEIKYMGYFKGTGSTFQRLNNGVDYIFERNIIKLINPAIIAIQGEISVTIRYVHAPVYYMIDMKRESMESFELEAGSEKLIHLPVSGTARRSHYIIASPNVTGESLLNNSYAIEANPAVTYASQQAIVLPDNTAGNQPLVIPFVNQNTISVNHKLNRYVTVTIYDQNDLVMTPNIAYEAKRVDANNLLITFPQLQKGTIVLT